MADMPDNTATPTAVGARIRSAREARGLTQRNLADKLTCTDAAVGMWETGARSVSLSNLFAIADVLGVDPVWLGRGGIDGEAA